MQAIRVLTVLATVGLLSACGGEGTPYGGRFPPPMKEPPAGESVPPRIVVPETGKVAGRQIGGAAATFMTEDDRKILEATTQNALETGTSGNPMQWVNTNTGNRGSITPQPRFEMDGRNCREFHQTLVAGGSTSTGYGTACRDGGGIWRIAEDG